MRKVLQKRAACGQTEEEYLLLHKSGATKLRQPGYAPSGAYAIVLGIALYILLVFLTGCAHVWQTIGNTLKP